MAVSQNTQEGNGMGWYVFAGVVLGLAATLWLGIQGAVLVFPVPHLTFPHYLATLWLWRSSVVWGTGQTLPHPLAWHVVSAGVSILVVVVIFVLSAWAMHLRHGHPALKRQQSRENNGPPEKPRRWRDDPNNWRREF